MPVATFLFPNLSFLFLFVLLARLVLIVIFCRDSAICLCVRRMKSAGTLSFLPVAILPSHPIPPHPGPFYPLFPSNTKASSGQLRTGNEWPRKSNHSEIFRARTTAPCRRASSYPTNASLSQLLCPSTLPVAIGAADLAHTSSRARARGPDGPVIWMGSLDGASCLSLCLSPSNSLDLFYPSPFAQ
ncbi:hypothetical protein BKA81DRAFT_166222 [Phyllosticta paracitricarpa]|uniref:Secreted protein n=1 Tax=Phyllosticta paracitricarpa TaxID=2016321 RepID=A0ABR1NJI7_9PEZI